MTSSGVGQQDNWNLSLFNGQTQQTGAPGQLEQQGQAPGNALPWGPKDSAGTSDVVAKQAAADPSAPLLSPPKDLNGKISKKAMMSESVVISSAKETTQAAAASKGEDLSKSSPPSPAAIYSQVYNGAVDDALEALKKNSPSLSDDSLKKLGFALYHPELCDSKLLQSTEFLELQKFVDAGMAGKGEKPVGWKPDSSGLDNLLSSSYGDNFNSQLFKYAVDNNLSVKEQNQLKVMHFAPNLQIPDKEKLAPTLAKIESRAMEATRNDAGLPGSVPSDWRPPQDSITTSNFEKTIQNDYQVNNEMNLKLAVNAAKPPLANQEVALLRKAISDPNTPNVPEKIAKLAKSITAESLSQTQQAYGLAETWAPTGSSLWTGAPMALNALETGRQLQKVMDKILNDIPDGPGKYSLINILKAISDALCKLQQSIFDIELQKSQSMSKQQIAQKDAVEVQAEIYQKQLDEQKAQQEEIEKNQRKQNQVSGIMKIIEPITIAVTCIAVVAACATGNVALAAVLIVMLTVMVADKSDPNLHLMTNAVNGAGFMFKAVYLLCSKGKHVGSANDIWNDNDKGACIFGQVCGTLVIAVITAYAGSIGSGSSGAGAVAGTATESGASSGSAAGTTVKLTEAGTKGASAAAAAEAGTTTVELTAASADQAATQVTTRVSQVAKKIAEEAAESVEEIAKKTAEMAQKATQAAAGDSSGVQVSLDLADDIGAGATRARSIAVTDGLTAKEVNAVRFTMRFDTGMGVAMQAYSSTDISNNLAYVVLKSQHPDWSEEKLQEESSKVGMYITLAVNIAGSLAIAGVNAYNAKALAKTLDSQIENTNKLIENAANAGESAKWLKFQQYLLVNARAAVFAGKESGQIGGFFVNLIHGSTQMAEGGFGLWQGILQRDNYEMQGDLAVMKSKMDATSKKTGTEIDMLREMIQQLLKALNMLTQWNESVGSTQENMWKGLHQIQFAG